MSGGAASAQAGGAIVVPEDDPGSVCEGDGEEIGSALLADPSGDEDEEQDDDSSAVGALRSVDEAAVSRRPTNLWTLIPWWLIVPIGARVPLSRLRQQPTSRAANKRTGARSGQVPSGPCRPTCDDHMCDRYTSVHHEQAPCMSLMISETCARPQLLATLLHHVLSSLFRELSLVRWPENHQPTACLSYCTARTLCIVP